MNVSKHCSVRLAAALQVGEQPLLSRCDAGQGVTAIWADGGVSLGPLTLAAMAALTHSTPLTLLSSLGSTLQSSTARRLWGDMGSRILASALQSL